jgi:hypothetical protein
VPNVKHFPVQGKFIFTLENENITGAEAARIGTPEQYMDELRRINEWLTARGFKPIG